MDMDTTLPKPFGREDEARTCTEEEDAQYTAWVHAKAQEAMDDPRPDIAHEVVMAEIDALIEKAEARHRQQAAV